MADSNKTNASRKLGTHMMDRFAKHKKMRLEEDQRIEANYRQYKGRYPSDVEANFDENMSRAYPRTTRVKVESMVARLMNMMFPQSERNWTLRAGRVVDNTIEAMQQALGDFMQQQMQMQEDPNQPMPFDQTAFDEFMDSRNTDAVIELEKHLLDQMNDIGSERSIPYEALARKVVRSATMFGLGVLRGPLTESFEAAEIQMNEEGQPEVMPVTRYRPYFEYVPMATYYPDLHAPSFTEQHGAFVYEPITKQGMNELKDNDSYISSAIDHVLKSNTEGDYETSQVQQGFEAARGVNNSSTGKKDSGSRYGLHWFHGYITGKYLRGLVSTDKNDQDIDDDTEYRVFAETVAGYCIRVAIDPYHDTVNSLHHFVFEEDDSALIGESLPEVMRQSQNSIANGSRMLNDNSGAASGPQMEIDLGLLDTVAMGGDLTARPWKAWIKDSLETSHGDTRQAVRPITFDSHANELLQVIAAFKNMADEETFIGPATGGDMQNLPSEALRVASNASMILGNSALPFKEIVGNFDRFTVSVLVSLLDWNRLFNPDMADHVAVRPIAKGSTSLMAKEMRAFAIDNLTNTLTEGERDWISDEMMVKERLRVRDLDVDGLLVDKETADKRRNQREQNAQAMAELQQEMLRGEVDKLAAARVKELALAKRNLDGAESNTLKVLSSAIKDGVNIDELLERLAGAGDPEEQIEQAAPAGLPVEPGGNDGGTGMAGGGAA